MDNESKEIPKDQIQLSSHHGTRSDKFNNLTKSFLSATMPQVIATSSLISLIWAACYLFFLAILVFQAVLTVKEYYTYPVNVELTIEAKTKFLKFPAVTVCNNNIVKKSYISRIPKYKELASLSDVIYQQNLPERVRDTEVLESLGLHQCRDDPSTWIPGSWVCNGNQDCPDGLDEDTYKCSTHQPLNHSENCLDEFEKCPGESTCAVLCDGVNDCIQVPGYDESMEQGCPPTEGTTYLTAEPFPQNISSPNFPNIYSNNLEKTYIITAPENFVVKLDFLHFFIEECDRNSCWCDHVTIREGGDGTFFTFNGVARMCGEMCHFTPIESSTNQIIISFTTDYVNSYDGWSLMYWAIPETSKSLYSSHDVLYDISCGFNGFSDYDNVNSGVDEPTAAPEDYGTIDPDFINSDIFHIKRVRTYDWYSVYQSSKMPDFSDLTKFIKFEQDEIVGNGHQKEDFIVQCAFDGKPCDSSWFQKFQHASFGNCFTFNSVVNAQNVNQTSVDPKNTSKVGSKNGLSVTLFLDNEEYLGILGQKTGANVVLHNTDEYAPLLTKSILVNAGTATRMTLLQETVSRQSHPFSDCTDQWPEFLELNDIYQAFRYTLELCEYLCRQKTLAEVCGCTDNFDWNFSENKEVRNLARNDCDAWNTTEYECLVAVYVEFERGKRDCGCPNPCSENNFKVTISGASWPSPAYTSHLVSLMKQSESSKVRKIVNNILSESYSDESSKFVQNQKMKENFARLEVNFQTMAYQQVKESPKYNLSTLFGTIGGNLGLWLGWSILSVLEFFQWMGMTSLLFMMDRNKRKNKGDQPSTAETTRDPYS